MEQFYGLIIPLGMLAVLYFMIIRPQQKKEKKVREMRNSINVGDDVITIGGIYGKITKVKDDQITIEVGADKTKLVVARWAVGSKVGKES